jgi:hypothetical protein
MGKDGRRHQELRPSLPGARRGRYLSLRDHVWHINWRTCVADLLSRHKSWPKLRRDQAVAAALLFRLLTYVLQIPLGGVTYLIWQRNKSWRKPVHPSSYPPSRYRRADRGRRTPMDGKLNAQLRGLRLAATWGNGA